MLRAGKRGVNALPDPNSRGNSAATLLRNSPIDMRLAITIDL